jgi:hypothetical protein
MTKMRSIASPPHRMCSIAWRRPQSRDQALGQNYGLDPVNQCLGWLLFLEPVTLSAEVVDLVEHSVEQRLG